MSANSHERMYHSFVSSTDEKNVTVKSIAVVGAGIVGVTTAYMLARAGHRVNLIDADDGVALGTSFANGGQLSYSFVDAMSSPGLLAKMPGILLGKDPGFRIRWSADPRLMIWGSRFLLNGLPASEEKNTRALLRLSLHSRDVMNALLAQVSIDFQHRRSGKLFLYFSEKELQKASVRVRRKSEWGCPQMLLDAQQCLALEPGLGQLAESLAGGIFAEMDETGDAQRFASELLRIMNQQQLVETHFNCLVTGLRKNGNNIEGLDTTSGVISADAYVLATGPESVALAQGAGLKLPIYPVKGYSVTVPATESAPNISITDVNKKVLVCRLGDRLRIAGCADIVGYDKSLDQARIQHLLSLCQSRFPDAGRYNEILDTWAGFRPVTPSSVPIIGKAGADNLYLNVGHGMLGWTLAAGSASLLTSIINGQASPIDSAGMRPVDHRVQ